MVTKKKASMIDYVWGTTRISIGLIFLWAFFDKLIGLGFTTCKTDGLVETMCEKAWLSGGSPTEGFLMHGTSGPFADWFQTMVGNGMVDLVFMSGLLAIGIGLTLGIAVKMSAYSAIAMLMLMWLAVLPPAHHPFIDDHVVYSLVLFGLTLVNDKQALGLGKWWSSLKIVKAVPLLR